MLPYGRQSISEADIEAVTAVLRGDWLTTGPTVTAFENAVSELAGGHRTVSCTSGTAALHIAYAALGVGPGDEVVTTPMTFVATASCAAMLGAKVVFADVDEDTALIDPSAVEAALTERTKVIAAVDYAGQAAEYAVLQPLADRVGARTLADAAHSIGGFADGRPVGDLADVTTMSFFPTKNLTTGEGGAVVCKDPSIGQRAHEFHFIGLVRDPDRFEITDEGPWHQEVHEYGVNYRLTDLGAALGLSQLAGSRSSSAAGPRSPPATTRRSTASTACVRRCSGPAWIRPGTSIRSASSAAAGARSSKACGRRASASR